jgi:H/ACA ribonucleoprotein complex subunit 2
LHRPRSLCKTPAHISYSPLPPIDRTSKLTTPFIAAVNKSLKRGVKEVVKALRKSPIPAANAAIDIPNGIVILAADISPMDVISHIPVLCEDHGIPYVFVTSRAELGASAATKRPTSVAMVVPKSANKGKKSEGDDEEFSKVYEELAKLVQKEAKGITV